MKDIKHDSSRNDLITDEIDIDLSHTISMDNVEIVNWTEENVSRFLTLLQRQDNGNLIPMVLLPNLNCLVKLD
jgi:hypothetical protein